MCAKLFVKTVRVCSHRSQIEGITFYLWQPLKSYYLPYIKFARGFQVASAQAQFYTQRSSICLSALWKWWTCSTNKTKTSPVLCSSAALKHTQRTHVYVRESYRLLFISIPVPSQSFEPACKAVPKTKRCIRLKLLLWREPLFILTQWRLKEIARNQSLISWRFLEYFRASESTEINGMCSNHRHKIRFQDVVY